MCKMFRGLSLLITLLMLIISGCGRTTSNSEEATCAVISTESNDSDEKYKNYLQACIDEVIVQSTGCSSVHSDIEMSTDGTIAKVEIYSEEYTFSDMEKEAIVQYIEKLGVIRDVEIVFGNESQGLSSDEDSVKNIWYETRYYPIYPGNPEWGKHDMDEVFEANNPPKDLLFSMPSDELAALLFESPYLTQMLTYYGEDGHIDYSMMFAFLELHSDIFYELLRREDGIKAILLQFQYSRIDAQWFEDESYNTSDEEWRRFLAEVFGSQFIHYYSVIFTEEETNLAKQIISEKNNVYLCSGNANPEYFNVADIEYYNGNSAGDVRVMYMTYDQILERENSLKTT